MACFSNVNVRGALSVGDIADLEAEFDKDPPYVDTYSVIAIPGTNRLGASLSVEVTSDFRVYAFASQPSVPAFPNASLFKRFYAKQAAAGNGGAFFVGLANNDTTGAVQTFANVEILYNPNIQHLKAPKSYLKMSKQGM